MWTGTDEQYFNLYTVTANHLKNRFGDTIKVGGFASCGFHAVEEKFNSGIFLRAMTFFHAFMEHITSDSGKAPLDFFSFHIYSGRLYRLKLHTLYARKTLDEYGFKNAELSMNEWNISGEYYANRSANATAFYGSFLCLAQSLPLDTCMFYGSGHDTAYANLFEFVTKEPLKPYYAFYSFNKPYELGTCVKTENDGDEIYMCASTDKKRCAIMLCKQGDAVREKISLNVDRMFDVYVTDKNNNCALTGQWNSADGYIDLNEDSITLLISVG